MIKNYFFDVAHIDENHLSALPFPSIRLHYKLFFLYMCMLPFQIIIY